MKTWKTRNGYIIKQLLAGRSNVFLVSKGKTNVLVDTSPARKWNLLRKRLRKLNIETIDFLVLTHVHFDHIGNALRIRNQFHSKVIVHYKEAELLKEGIIKIPAGSNPITRFMVNRFGKFVTSVVRIDPCTPDILVESGFNFEEHGLNAYLIDTPGHTFGSMSLIVDDEVAIVGDAMFGIFPGSVFPPFADDTNEMINSWGKLLETNCNCFLPSHGTRNSRKLIQASFDKRKVSKRISRS